jgi:Tol biopolymer transport system component
MFVALTWLLAACGPGRVADQIAITLTDEGQTRELVVPQGSTVRDVLIANNITLGELDRVRPTEVTLLQNGMAITVTRVTQTEAIITQTTSFRTLIQYDASLPAGQERIIEPGRNGLITTTYRITLSDNREISREEIRQEQAEPRTEVKLVGLQGAFNTVPFSGTLVYLSNNNAFVIRDIAGNKRPLTTEGDLDGRVLSLSADGRWLMYTRAATKTLNSLWLVDTTLARPETKSLNIGGVLWADFSPDGKSIAYTRADLSPGQPGWRAFNDLLIAPFTNGKVGTSKTILPQSSNAKYSWWGTAYAWSPDSKLLAYANTESIGVISPTARLTKTQVLTNFAAFDTRSTWAWTPLPTWSADGRFIVSTIHAPSPTGESVEDSPAFNLLAIEITPSLQLRLINDVGMWSAPRWTPGDLASSRIIFGFAETPFASDTSRYKLYRMDRDGSNRTLLFPEAEAVGLDGLPDYDLAPDGRSLVVAYQGDLYLVNVNTGNMRRLTAEGSISHPRWSN